MNASNLRTNQNLNSGSRRINGRNSSLDVVGSVAPSSVENT